jgi:hypothetical protein
MALSTLFAASVAMKLILWCQAGQILYALDNLDRRKPQERMRRFCLGSGTSTLMAQVPVAVLILWLDQLRNTRCN